MDKKYVVSRAANQVVAAILTKCLSTEDESVRLEIHMHRTVKGFSFNSKQGAAIFSMPENIYESTTKNKQEFAYLVTIKPLKYYPFNLVLNHLKFNLYENQHPAFILCKLDIIKHVHYSATYNVTESHINFDTFQFDVDQFCVDFILK